jgi:hypothetical protein
MSDRSQPNVYLAGKGFLAFIRRATCLEADSNVKLLSGFVEARFEKPIGGTTGACEKEGTRSLVSNIA